ncbi:TetR family transcriptional regulator C-terminal domain-containing protein [Xinfangfangia pollutisoli]|uniref:TetR family transcriptional regulator C-terminal domain-containing protein n=1 Tax=Xinfangfangia pollutisoli TaxID=2865960 RepID=UPI001CD50912|nr:TetR family transcriptional regulator C-terminal domain-containing protein [Xinfangfangia pollutisoli]
MLVNAGLVCLARGGITAFTIDNICQEAGASRGLIAHHFGSKDGLLAAVYAAAYRNFLSVLAPDAGIDLRRLIDTAFSEELFRRDPLNIWLALWGEVAINAALRDEHRAHYAIYLARVEAAIAAHAAAQGRSVDAAALARPVVALIDGLWLEAHIDAAGFSPATAKAAALALLEAALGPLG